MPQQIRTLPQGTVMAIGGATARLAAIGSSLRGTVTARLTVTQTDGVRQVVDLSMNVSIDFNGAVPAAIVTGGRYTKDGVAQSTPIGVREVEWTGTALSLLVDFGPNSLRLDLNSETDSFAKEVRPFKAAIGSAALASSPSTGVPNQSNAKSLAEVAFDAADRLRTQGKIDQAIGAFSLMLADNPFAPAELRSNGWASLGQLHLQKKDGARAREAFEQALEIGGLRTEAVAAARQMLASARQLEASASANTRAVPSPAPVPRAQQSGNTRASGPPRTLARQTVSASAIESATWRPLTFVCGATYEVTFLDREARDWTFWRLGRRANNLASSDTPFETPVWNGVPRVGTRIHIPSSLCPGGNGNVTLDSYAYWSRSGYGRVAVLDEVEEKPEVADPALAPFAGVWRCLTSSNPTGEYPLTIRSSGQAVWLDWEETAAPVRVSGQAIHIDMQISSATPDPRFRQVFDLSLVGQDAMRGSLVEHLLYGVGSSARVVPFTNQVQCRRTR